MDQEESTPGSANSLPQRTTPTWEIELLLSGATVFALFQLVQGLHASGVYLLPRLTGDTLQFMTLLFTYSQGAAVLLAISFSLHLTMRAYWVALVGMHSVFPSGVKVERTQAGPIAKALLQARWRSMEDGIEQADNRATIVFALGVAITLVLIPVTFTVSVLFGLAMLLAWLVGYPDSTMLVYALIAALGFTPYGIATLLDKHRGDRMAPNSRSYRWITATLALYSRIGMSRDAFPLLAVFQNNIGERRGSAIVAVIMVVVMAAAGLSLVLGQNELGYGSFGGFADPRRGMPASTEGRHYASMYETGRAPTVPYIPDLVAKEAYLRLVVPYVPRQHQHLLDRCEGKANALDDAAAESRRRQLRLACIAKGIDVRVDGVPVAALPDWYSDPGQDLRGLLYMIPIHALAEGRHEASVMPEPEQAPKPGEPPPQPYRIPFWR